MASPLVSSYGAHSNMESAPKSYTFKIPAETPGASAAGAGHHMDQDVQSGA
jgi:hypothetical protein